MKLLVIRPVIRTQQLDSLTGELDGEELTRLCGSTAEIEVAYLPTGPASVECEYDEIAAAPAICRIVSERSASVDGFLIDCFVDPAIDAARELSLHIPVLGAGEASLAFATQLGERISIVTVVESVARMIWRRVLRHGMQERVARPRYISIPVLQTTDRAQLVDLISAQAKEAVEKEGADVILLGCTGFRGLALDVSIRMRSILGKEIPVVDPALAALKMLEAMVNLGLSHSKIAFSSPSEKIRTGFNCGE